MREVNMDKTLETALVNWFKTSTDAIECCRIQSEDETEPEQYREGFKNALFAAQNLQRVLFQQGITR